MILMKIIPTDGKQKEEVQETQFNNRNQVPERRLILENNKLREHKAPLVHRCVSLIEIQYCLRAITGQLC